MIYRMPQKKTTKVLRHGRSRVAGANHARWRGVAATVLRKECRRLFLNLSLVAPMVISSVLVGWISWTSAAALQQTQLNRIGFAEAERQRWLAQSPTSPHGAAHHGVYVFTPLTASASVDPGPMQWVGQTIWLEAHKQNLALYPLAQDLGLRDGLDEHSIVVWVLIIIPLILALLTYDSIAGEREDGTLRLAVAAAAPPSALIVGKLTTAFLAACLLTIPAGIALASKVKVGLPIIALAAIYAVYLFQFTALVLTSSILLPSRRAALSAALLIWFGSAIAVPGAFAHAAALAAPEPTSTEIRAAIIRHTQERPTLWDRREEINQRFLREFNVKSLTELPVNPDGILLMEQERDDTAATSGNIERIYSAHRRQQEIYGWGSILSPAIATDLLSSAVSGSSLWHFQHFAYAAEDYRRKLVGFLNEATAYDVSIRTGTVHTMAAALNVQAGSAMWAKAPVFEYQQPDMAASLAPERWRIVAFMSWTVLTVGGLLLASRRVAKAA